MKQSSEVKKEMQHQEWLEMVQACQNSGKPVKTWCRENGIKVCTYYSRQKKLRTEALGEPEGQSIVPVSISEEMSTSIKIINQNSRRIAGHYSKR